MGILGHPGFDGDGRLPWPNWLRAVVLTVSVVVVTLLAFAVVNRVTAEDYLQVETQAWDDAKIYPLYHSGMKTEEAPL
jgi:hypothetical protein